MKKLEICCDSVRSALAAERGGAARIELCANLLEGGTTPSAGLISLVRDSVSIPLHVLIRPRGGDFYYSAEEKEVMRRDIQTAKELGADGVVLGMLMPDGSIDLEGSRELIELARPLRVTYHRAFDLCGNPATALEQIIALGADYLLTSGQKNTAFAGMELIAELLDQSKGRIVIMPGGGINEQNIRQLSLCTGANEFHSSCRTAVPSGMQFQRKGVFMGAWQEGEYRYSFVNAERVRKMMLELTR